MSYVKRIAIPFRRVATTSVAATQVPLFETCEGRVLMAIDFAFDSTGTEPLSDSVAADFGSETADIAYKKKSVREAEKFFDTLTADNVVTFDELAPLNSMSTGSTPK